MTADFHTHILPGVDDGSKSTDQSLQMLRLCRDAGIRHVVLTPHFYPDRDQPDRFLERRNGALEAVQKAAAGEQLPEMILGAEVHYFPNMSSSDVLPRLTIGESRYLLVEMPSCRWTDRMYRELEKIRENQGIIPIIAHLDRYLTPFRAGEMLRRISELPVLVQVNGSFFLRSGTAGFAMRMMKNGQIHLLGSDCHNLDDRSPNLGQVRQRIHIKLGTEALERIGYYEQHILTGGKKS